MTEFRRRPSRSLPTSRPRIVSKWPAAIMCLVAVCAAVEAALWAADLGLIDMRRLRALAYQNGGFWIGLLSDWEPNYAAQPYLMFVTYAFLHGGLVHLAVNMLTLYSVGQLVISRVGQMRFLLLYAVSAFGGALGFAALSTSYQPMVGASGALFGLVGAWIAWDYIDRFGSGAPLLPVLRPILTLILLNVVLYYAMGGFLAWETHLGGFLAGAFCAFLVDPVSRSFPDQRA
ncbi:rhomboid family intramembrane serine protease [Roseitranquillus sediminis]|uniref:rhomboid family intramembrane serine protease n=1 Tax=Roseitranquillus sediminis TaxID=2809051 RepID=UPI001D0C7038|nr:rhomboid family intramembrane serine protease [Roseitranquillus sediminis]MBM9596181.1 rhomboid family intramembrane serine protease [Roseitranquillus sediminis]